MAWLGTFKNRYTNRKLHYMGKYPNFHTNRKRYHQDKYQNFHANRKQYHQEKYPNFHTNRKLYHQPNFPHIQKKVGASHFNDCSFILLLTNRRTYWYVGVFTMATKPKVFVKSFVSIFSWNVSHMHTRCNGDPLWVLLFMMSYVWWEMRYRISQMFVCIHSWSHILWNFTYKVLRVLSWSLPAFETIWKRWEDLVGSW